MTFGNDWSLPVTLTVFAASALVILLVGIRLTRVADQLADLTGLGEAVFGAALLGASTSLPGIIASVTAAAADHPQLAVSNAIGGIAVQTAFLALADMAYRGTNLEHAAAAVENLVNGAMLCALLGLVLLASAGPQWHLFAIHPATLIILGGYLFGLKLAAFTHDSPAWNPEKTRETKVDEPEPDNLDLDGKRLWSEFFLLALVIGVAGYLVGTSGIAVVRSTGISETVVGGLFTAIATSLPELVTAIAAVRQGSPTLAVGAIIGGNTFDVLFVAFADVAYRKGSVYHAIGDEQRFMIALTIVLSSILLLGMVRREKRGLGNIGFEGVLVLLFYIGGFTILGFGLIGA